MVTRAKAQVREWEEALKAFHERFKPHFAFRESWWMSGRYMWALMLPLERKNGWHIAEALGESSPASIQQFIKAAVWSDRGVCDAIARYAYEHLGEPEGVLALDETGFIKKGKMSAGVARQYVGCTGQVENAQVAVFMAYVSAKGATLVDRELYLPKEWTDDRERSRKARIPDEREFATKIGLGQRMVARATSAGAPFRWVVADEVYGPDASFRRWLEDEGLQYALGVPCNYLVWWGDDKKRVDQLVPAHGWERLSAGDGVQGPRWFEWAARRYQAASREGWDRWVIFRRGLDGGGLQYYLASAPASTSLTTFVKAMGARWAIETCFEQAKGEVGLGDYEVRTWHGWHRHVTLAMGALAFLNVMRHEARTPEPDKKGALEAAKRENPLAKFRRSRGL